MDDYFRFKMLRELFVEDPDFWPFFALPKSANMQTCGSFGKVM
jgi:hypothetical protein